MAVLTCMGCSFTLPLACENTVMPTSAIPCHTCICIVYSKPLNRHNYAAVVVMYCMVSHYILN